MDPIGVITGVVDLFSVAKKLDDLRLAYKDAPAALGSLVEACEITKTLMEALRETLRDRPGILTTSSAGKKYLQCFNAGIAQLESQLKELRSELRRFDSNKKAKLGFWSKTKFIWHEDYLDSSLQGIRDSRQLVDTVLQGISVLILLNPTPQTFINPTVTVPRQPSPGIQAKTADEISVEFKSAVIAGNVSQATRFLRGGVSPNLSLTTEGTRALHCAAQEGSQQMIELLISYGADVGYQRSDGFSALHVALSSEKDSAALSLLAHDANPSAVTKSGLTPLHFAARRNLYLPSQWLLERGADPNAIDNSGWTPLHCALGPKDSSRKPLPLNLRLLSLLVAFRADPTIAGSQQRFPLHYIAERGLADAIDILAPSPRSVDVRGRLSRNSPLQTAVYNGHINCVKGFIKYGANVDLSLKKDSHDVTILWHAMGRNKLAIAEALLQAGANPDVKYCGETILRFIAKDGEIEKAKLLIRYKASLTAPDDATGRGPIHVAAGNKRYAFVQLLLDSGVDANSPDREDGKTPFAYAANVGDVAMMRLLLSRGARWDTKYGNGGCSTAFKIALASGHVHAVVFLLGLGADLNEREGYNLTALHVAATAGHEELVALLLSLGARRDLSLGARRDGSAVKLSVGKYSSGGGTPAEMAREQGHVKVAEMIEKFSSELDTLVI